MSTLASELCWSSLKLSEPEIPWDDLRRLAEAAAASREVRSRLIGEAQDCLDARYDEEKYEVGDLRDLAVPAVLALAADRMDDEAKREAAEFMIRTMRRAGEEDDDFTMSVIELAAGKLGPALIDPIIRTVEENGSDLECWCFLFSLLGVAREADAQTQTKVVRLCRRLIEEAPEPYALFSPADAPACLLATLGDTESLDLIRPIVETTDDPELLGLIDRLEDRDTSRCEDVFFPWVTPVEEWLPGRVQKVREFFANGETDPDEFGEEALKAQSERYEQLVGEFVESSAYQALPEDLREHAGFACVSLSTYALDYVGTPIENATRSDIRELLLDIFPRKISAEKEFFERAPGGLKAFVTWLGERGECKNAPALRDEIQRCAKKMVRCSQDPSNWGMAKSFIMRAMAAGVNVDDGAELQRYMLEYNRALMQASEASGGREDEMDLMDLLVAKPIVRGTQRVGRNDPCPCGSGRKYKKCCGH